MKEADARETEVSDTVKKQRLPTQPYEPTAKERRKHEVDHIPYRAWCPECVAGKARDRKHMQQAFDPDAVPVIEFDYASGSDKREDVEHSLRIFTAADNVHGGCMCA